MPRKRKQPTGYTANVGKLDQDKVDDFIRALGQHMARREQEAAQEPEVIRRRKRLLTPPQRREKLPGNGGFIIRGMAAQRPYS
jgi:hypothetical protein